MKKHKNKIIAGAVIALVLIFVYWWGGDAPGLRGLNMQTEDTAVTHIADKELVEGAAEPGDLPEGESKEAGISGKAGAEKNTSDPKKKFDTDREALSTENSVEEIPVRGAGRDATRDSIPQRSVEAPLTAEEKTAPEDSTVQNYYHNAEAGDRDYSQNKGMQLDEETGKDRYMTAPVPEGRPIPVEPDNVVISDRKYTCTLSVRCDTILANIARLDREKTELVPDNGVIYEEQTVTFYEGESVFNVLVREMKKNKIHMEFVNTPIYNSAYIEGIGNLYEYDCGELSGWMYRVNGWFPNYGCSRYQLKNGDRIEWIYTCELGMDIGRHNSAAGE
ncbi:MAG: DUF4430 domain-containing protein [Clostridia bacterium]|nr:DUF4430 domain-containing protein [Clostridia bacterium]